jgi:thioredoxin-like negative regulator of GroEL
VTSGFFLWWILAWITGSPLGALAFLLALWWLGDRASFRLLPDPFRAAGRWRRRRALEGTLLANPHDRRARLELAGLLLDVRRPAAALEVLMPNVEAGDDDPVTAYTLGAALARTGDPRAEGVLARAREADPDFRLGEIDLELARLRLARKDFEGARAALEALVAARPGTVQGRVLLARARRALGDRAGAEAAEREAWQEYRALPRFHRRVERAWAWRARPWRPVLYAGAVVAVVLVLAALAPGR